MARRLVALVTLMLAVLASEANAEILLPPGFTVQVYVTGDGFDTAEGRLAHGIPSASTLAIDHAGTLYLARPGRRYTSGEIDDLWPVYRFPAGGGRATKATEARYLYGPPLPSAQIAGVRAGRELLVTTFDRDRKVGVLYVMVNGSAELFAGGTPPRGATPVLVQPEGAAADAAASTAASKSPFCEIAPAAVSAPGKRNITLRSGSPATPNSSAAARNAST